MSKSVKKRTASKHFELQPLADGVFAAIATEGGAAIGNAGLIALDGLVLLFDSFMTPQAARVLRQASLDIFGRAPHMVINSHYHNDHIWGNQVFAGEALILAAARTRELIATAGYEEFQWYSAHSAERLASLRDEYQAAEDKRQRQRLSFSLGYYEGLVEALPHLEVCMPTTTFEGEVEFHAKGRRARLSAVENAHTGSDALLHLTQDGVVFLSDLLFVDYHPFFPDGDALHHLEILRELQDLEATHFVPGHGPVGTSADIARMIDYIEYCLETARGLVKAGDANAERIAALEIEERFRGWGLPQFFAMNIQYLCEGRAPAGGRG